MTVDNIHLYDTNATYTFDADTYVATHINLTKHDDAVMNFVYSADVEDGHDWLSLAFHNASGWFHPLMLNSTSDWETVSLVIPSDTDMVGFYFHSDGTVVSAGAYVDDLKIVGRRTAVFDELSINSTLQTLHRQGDRWVMTWNTSEVDEGLYEVEALAHCGHMPLADRTTVIVDRTAPEAKVMSQRLQSGNNITLCVDTGIGGGSPIISVKIADSGLSALLRQHHSEPQCHMVTLVALQLVRDPRRSL